jgi:carboxymethylenebutenolidase
MALVLRSEGGEVIPGFLIEAHHQGLILVHEIFGLTSPIRYMVRRFAAEGLTTFAIDLFEGKVALDEAKGAVLAQGVVWRQAIDRIRQAAAALARQGQGAPVGICGLGFGGAMALAAAAHLPELAACVSFYGIPTTRHADLLRIGCKVQGHFGALDRLVTPDRVDAFEARLTGAGIAAEIHRYNTEHFFMNSERRKSYSPHNSELAYHRAVAFLKRELGSVG